MAKQKTSMATVERADLTPFAEFKPDVQAGIKRRTAPWRERLAQIEADLHAISAGEARAPGSQTEKLHAMLSPEAAQYAGLPANVRVLDQPQAELEADADLLRRAITLEEDSLNKLRHEWIRHVEDEITTRQPAIAKRLINLFREVAKVAGEETACIDTYGIMYCEVYPRAQPNVTPVHLPNMHTRNDWNLRNSQATLLRWLTETAERFDIDLSVL